MPGSEFVWLQNGYAAPVAVFDLVLACEKSGVRLKVVDGDVIASSPQRPELITDELIAELRAWKPHVVAILQYTPDDRHLRDETAPRPHMGPVGASTVERNRRP